MKLKCQLLIGVGFFCACGTQGRKTQEHAAITGDSVSAEQGLYDYGDQKDSIVQDEEGLRCAGVSQPVEYGVVGKFFTPYRVDTLVFNTYYNNEGVNYNNNQMLENIDKGFSEGFKGDDGLEIRVKTSTGKVVHTQKNAINVCCTIPLTGFLGECDALAIVWTHPQPSQIEMCRIISIRNGKWRVLGEFMVHALMGSFLENHDGVWMYRDYTEWVVDPSGNFEDSPMKHLKKLINKKVKSHT